MSLFSHNRRCVLLVHHMVFINWLCIVLFHFSTERTQLAFMPLLSFNSASVLLLHLGHIPLTHNIIGSIMMFLPFHLLAGASINWSLLVCLLTTPQVA